MTVKVYDHVAAAEGFAVFRLLDGPNPIQVYGANAAGFTVFESEAAAEAGLQVAIATKGELGWRIGRVFWGWPLPAGEDR